VAERFDTPTGRRTDRLLFDGARLVRHDLWISDIQRSTVTYEYDDVGRRVRKDACGVAGAGMAGWHPVWRQPPAWYEQELRSSDVEVVEYVGDTRRPAYVESISVNETGGETTTFGMALCYAYDRQERRRRRFQVHRELSDPGYGADTATRTYHYFGNRLVSIDYESFNLHRSGDTKSQSSWSARFEYDKAGRLVSTQSTGGTSRRLEYDERGLLVRAGQVTFGWNPEGRLASRSLGDVSFAYDATGRIVEAAHRSGDGYRVEWSDDCAAGLSHPLLTPNVDAWLYFEGRDTL
jgi:YD repeat-containing protein